MTFKIIALTIGISGIIKGLSGFFFHESLYSWARKHYSSKKWNVVFLGFLVYALGLLAASWYGYFFDNKAYGWIITLFVSIASLKLFGILFQWEKTSKAFTNFIDKSGKTLYILDALVLILGFVFIALGIFIY